MESIPRGFHSVQIGRVTVTLFRAWTAECFRERLEVGGPPNSRTIGEVTTWRQYSYNGVTMTTAITVRNVPEEVRDELAARASRSGRSLQEFLLNHLTEVASRPSVEEVVGRARERARLTGSGMNVASILSDRNAERR